MAYQFIYLTESGMTFYGKYDQYTIYATQSCTPFISIYDPHENSILYMAITYLRNRI